MPSRKVHNMFARILNLDPKLANSINKEIDYPARYLGPKHRALNHDLAFAVINSMKYRDKGQALALHMLHYTLDRMSRDKRMRKIFELMDAT